MTRRTKCASCGCHEFDKVEGRHLNGDILLLWRCIDCGADMPRVSSRQLAQRKSRLLFESSDTVHEQGKHRAVVIEAKPYTAVVRLSGLRTPYEVSWAGVYNMAVKLAVAKAKAEKKAAKKRGR